MSIGYQFPFQVSSGSVGYFQMTNSELQAVSSNLRVLLLTNRGERPMNFDFGCNLREFLFEQASRDELGQRIADRVIQQVTRWMPFVSLVRLNVLFTEDDSAVPENSMLLKISFKLTSRPDQIETFTQLVSA